MVYAVEAWTVPTDEDEEPCEQEMVQSEEFPCQDDAMQYAWSRLEEGYFVRLWRR